MKRHDQIYTLHLYSLKALFGTMDDSFFKHIHAWAHALALICSSRYVCCLPSGSALLPQVMNLIIANVYKCRAKTVSIDECNVHGGLTLLQNFSSESFKSIWKSGHAFLPLGSISNISCLYSTWELIFINVWFSNRLWI